MAEMLHIGADFFAALDDYVHGVCAATPEAGYRAIEAYVEDLRSRASQHHQWSGLADHIEAWEEDGQPFVGVRHPEHAERALNAEYGFKDTPPAPIFRNAGQSERKASEAMASVYRKHLGA